MHSNGSKSNVIQRLFEVGCLKFGEFVLKSGDLTPIYVDLRVMVSHPEIISTIGELVWQEKLKNDLDCDVLCGVPYTALPVATAIAIKNNFPMLLKRKEVKTYGTKNILEGKFRSGDKCLIVEDVVTSGSSVLETAEILRREGLVVSDCIVILNREQGGRKNLQKHGISLHSLFTLSNVVQEIQHLNLISDALFQSVEDYLKNNCYIGVQTPAILPFSERVDLCTNSVSKNLLAIIERKQTNLCVAIDVLKSCDLLRVAAEVGPHICVLKTHIDIVEDFSDDTVLQLRELAQEHDFLIMEDRKFGDIGNTVALQYSGGVYKIKEWADIVTVHSVPGEGVIEALKKCASQNRACVIVAEMSSKGALTDDRYRDATLKIAEKHRDFVIGFVSQSRLAGNDFLYMCPGVNFCDKGDSLGQQYRSPEEAIKKDLIDIVIVGRGITGAEDVTAVAKRYKERAFAAYKETLL